MAKRLKQGHLTAEVFFETWEDNYGRTKDFGESSLKGTFRSAKNANFVVAIFDDEGNQLGMDVKSPLGKLSEEIHRLMSEVLQDEDDPPHQEVIGA